MIAEPLFWLLSFIHSVVGNWGWSIILLTVLIKAVFFPAVRGELSFDGEDEDADAEDEGHPGALRC